MADTQLTLRFHHDVIEHLGLRLYQNKPTKVICELVSNSWDADASRVAIETAPTGTDRPVQITVLDNGRGMTRSALQSSFLTIASPRRGRANSVTKSSGGRPLMGRKGLGKLAPFGISKRVNVVSVSGGKANWIQLDLDEIAAISPDSTDPDMARYHPKEILADATLDDLAATEHEGFSGSTFLAFLQNEGSDSGTAIILTQITDRAIMSNSELKIALGRRFTVTLARTDFQVTVNDASLEEDHIYPRFVLRIPEQGYATDDAGENTVRFWVGFTDKPVSPSSEAGIGVYAHGKLAQERPFFFFVKGNDIVLPYIYGVVEADWVDEVSEDLISTDRSNLDWKHPATQHLLAWGQRRIRDWLNKYQDYRRNTEASSARAFMMSDDADERIKLMTQAERESLVTILAEITPALPPAPETRAGITEALTDAWLHKPARDMINKLWDQLKTAAESTQNIGPIIESIRQYVVPEAMSSTVTLSQRAFALTVLHNLINNGKEPDLQKLIEVFPWLIGPDGEYLTANKPLREFVEAAEASGKLPRQSDKNETVTKDSLRPDFVFLSNSKQDEIIVVEIKSPQVELTIPNREQLHGYMTYLEQKYTTAKIRGILVGNAPNGMTTKNVDMTWLSWGDVFSRSKAAYAEIIASMISGYADSSRDLRVREIQSYGGEEIWKVIRQVSESDTHLKQLLADFNAT